jgi:hypothetical protein
MHYKFIIHLKKNNYEKYIHDVIVRRISNDNQQYFCFW